MAYVAASESPEARLRPGMVGLIAAMVAQTRGIQWVVAPPCWRPLGSATPLSVIPIWCYWCMIQTFLTYSLSDDAHVRVVTTALTRAGFAVGDANRLVSNSISIRVREGTDDLVHAEQIINAHGPGATRLPDATPSTVLRGYREGL